MKGRSLWIIVVMGATVLLPPHAAYAHGGEEDVTAKMLVEQAIAILDGQPEMGELAIDKINDALKDYEVEGVDLTLLQEAGSALESGRTQDALELLQRSIGLEPQPSSPRDRAIPGGFQAPRGVAGSALLAIAAVLVLVGALVAKKVR